ncbi:MAG: DUF3883 domain-containing protein [Planctomycetaceae bacterium]
MATKAKTKRVRAKAARKTASERKAVPPSERAAMIQATRAANSPHRQARYATPEKNEMKGERAVDANGLTAKDHIFMAYHDALARGERLTWGQLNWTTNKAKYSHGHLSDLRNSRGVRNYKPRPKRILDQAKADYYKAFGINKAGQQLLQGTGTLQHSERSTTKPSLKRSPDPLRRQEVEAAAVRCIVDRFTSKGYAVRSVESDNVGWDLEAVKGSRKLLLEVKGLSGSELCIELTPNEYAKLQEHRQSYRLCVVTNALTIPKVALFEYSNKDNCWIDQFGRRLNIEERIAARCRAS